MTEDATPKMVLPGISQIKRLGFNAQDGKGDILQQKVLFSGFQGDLFVEFTDLALFVQVNGSEISGENDVTPAVLKKFFSTDAVFGKTGDVDSDGNPVSQKTNIFLREVDGKIVPAAGTIGLFSFKVNAPNEPKVDNTNLNFIKGPDTNLLPASTNSMGLRIVFRFLRADGKAVEERTLSEVVGWRATEAKDLAGGIAYVGIRVFDAGRKLVASSLARTSNLAVPNGDIKSLGGGQTILRYVVEETSSKPVDHGKLGTDGQSAFVNKPLSEFPNDFTGCYGLTFMAGHPDTQTFPVPDAVTADQRAAGKTDRINAGGSFYEVFKNEQDRNSKRAISPYVLRINQAGRYAVGWIRRADEYPTTGSQGPAFKEVMDRYTRAMKALFGSENDILVVIDLEPVDKSLKVMFRSVNPTTAELNPTQLAIPGLNDSKDAVPSIQASADLTKAPTGDFLQISIVPSATAAAVLVFQQYSQAETFPPFTITQANANWRDAQEHMRRVNASVPTGVTMHKYGGGGGFGDFFKAFCDMRKDGFDKNKPSFAKFKAAVNDIFVKTQNSPHRETQQNAFRTALKAFTDSEDTVTPQRKFFITLKAFFDREWQEERPKALENARDKIPNPDGLSEEGKKEVERIKQDVLAAAYKQWLSNDQFRGQLHALGITAESQYTYKFKFTPIEKGGGGRFISGSLGGFLLEVRCFHFTNDKVDDKDRKTPKFWLDADQAKEGGKPDGVVNLQGVFGSLGIGFKFSKTPLKKDDSGTKTGGSGSASPIDFEFNTSLQLMPDQFIGARMELAAVNFGPSVSGSFGKFDGKLRFGFSRNTISITIGGDTPTVLEAEVAADTFEASAAYPGKDAQSYFDVIYAMIQSAGDPTALFEGGPAFELQIASAAYGMGWIASFNGNSGEQYDLDEYDPEVQEESVTPALFLGVAEILFKIGKFELEPKAEKQLLVHIASYRSLFTQRRTASLVCHGFSSAEHQRSKNQADADQANKLLSLLRATTVANFMLHVLGKPGEGAYLDPELFIVEVYGKGPLLWYKRLQLRKDVEEGRKTASPDTLRRLPTVHPFDPTQDAVKLEGQARVDRLLAEREGVNKLARKVILVTTHQVTVRVYAN